MESEAHTGLAVQLIRWAPLLGILLVTLWAATSSLRAHRGRSRDLLASGAVIALSTAGIIHILLVPSHWSESRAAGVFFAGSGVGEIALAVWLWRGVRRASAVAVVILVAALTALYIESRVWAAPFIREREALDALGLVTKALEVAAAAAAILHMYRRPLPRLLSVELVAAAMVTALALTVRPLVDLGPSPGQLTAAVISALGVTVLIRGRRVNIRGVAVAVLDAGVLALVLRAGGAIPFVAGGILAAVIRSVVREQPRLALSPVPLAGLSVLAVSSFGARLEILHMGHGEPWPSFVAFLAGAIVAGVAWRRGQLPAVVVFYAVHLGLQAIRVLAGRTSVEAVEIPAASIGLLVIVGLALADPELIPRGRAGLVVATVAGVTDVFLRDRGVPYQALFGVAAAIALGVGVWGVLSHEARQGEGRGVTAAGRPPPSARLSGTGRSSRGTPAST